MKVTIDFEDKAGERQVVVLEGQSVLVVALRSLDAIEGGNAKEVAQKMLVKTPLTFIPGSFQEMVMCIAAALGATRTSGYDPETLATMASVLAQFLDGHLISQYEKGS